MILRSYNTDKFKGIDNNYQELSEKYPHITSNGDTALDMEYHYNELQKEDYAQLLTELGQHYEVFDFYNTFQITEGQCWETSYQFCSHTDPYRFEMVEGYYEGMKSLYHWMVIDTITGNLIDPHFDLMKETISDFTITGQQDIWTYQCWVEYEEEERKKEEEQSLKDYEKMIKNLRSKFGDIK